MIRLDNAPVLTTSDLVRLVLTSYRVGDTVAVTVTRGRLERTFAVTLAEL